MKVINIILASIIIYLGVGSTCFAQENDKALLERVDKVYRLILIDLNTDELLQKINEVEKYVGLVIDSFESKEAKEKARLIQAKGLLWSLGNKEFSQALKSGVGSLLGFIFGTLLKFVVCGYFCYQFIIGLIR